MILAFFNLYFSNNGWNTSIGLLSLLCVCKCINCLLCLCPNFFWHAKIFLYCIMQIFLVCHWPFSFVHGVFWCIQSDLIMVSFVVSVMLGKAFPTLGKRNVDERWVICGGRQKGVHRERLIKPAANSRILTKDLKSCLLAPSFYRWKSRGLGRIRNKIEVAD